MYIADMLKGLFFTLPLLGYGDKSTDDCFTNGTAFAGSLFLSNYS